MYVMPVLTKVQVGEFITVIAQSCRRHKLNGSVAGNSFRAALKKVIDENDVDCWTHVATVWSTLLIINVNIAIPVLLLRIIV